ncbi:tyrosine-type recombinase/integrase [Ruminococcus albus]|uniref:Integrase/recombinase XerD n=1 Tax=Ruminococcus albus TaxID=1264 RepID=A0A1H7PJX3_RUMAL|nr:tyrosine-type recombinase/integrase [Ruminococcus albus]SEL35899.1 integrase/recombinase XerD [Ruminococcus albus]
MKVQKIKTENGFRYLLLDDNFQIIDEVYRYLRFLDSTGKSPNTLRSYAYHLKLFYQYATENNLDIFELFNNKKNKPIDILSNFLFWLQYPDTSRQQFHFEKENAKRSNNTVNLIVSTVLEFYEYLHRNNEIDEFNLYRSQRTNKYFKGFLYEMFKHNVENKRSILKRPVEYAPVNALTRKQYNELLSVCSCRRDQLLLAFMFEGGERLSETIGTHLCDLDNLEDGIVKIVPRINPENNARVKNYAGGLIKLPSYVIDLIIDYLTYDISNYDSDYLFLTLHGSNEGKPLQAANVEKLFARLSKKVGFKVHPHMLRHGFATEKLEAGWQMVDIQAYLRHKNLSSTQIYATYSDELKKEKMRSFLDKSSEKLKGTADELKKQNYSN